jgi:hypothetical protein
MQIPPFKASQNHLPLSEFLRELKEYNIKYGIEEGEKSPPSLKNAEYTENKLYSNLPSGQDDGVVFKNKRHYNTYLKEKGWVCSG